MAVIACVEPPFCAARGDRRNTPVNEQRGPRARREGGSNSAPRLSVVFPLVFLLFLLNHPVRRPPPGQGAALV